MTLSRIFDFFVWIETQIHLTPDPPRYLELFKIITKKWEKGYFGVNNPQCASNPVTEICEARGEWIIKTSTTLETMKFKFKLGQEFKDKTPDGHDVKAKVSFK